MTLTDAPELLENSSGLLSWHYRFTSEPGNVGQAMMLGS